MRLLRLLGPLVLLCVGLVGCPEPDPDEGPCGLTEPLEKGQAGATCNLAQDCATEFGCMDGRCSSCLASTDCGEFMACNAGSCGQCSLSAPCRDGETCVDGFCLPEIEDWQLTFTGEDPEADWAELQEEIYDDDLYFPCNLRVGTRDYGDCKVRIQGASSRYFPKKSVRILFGEGDEHPGFSRKVNLRAEWADPTFLRTTLGYATFRRLSRTPTVRTKHVFLHVNGEPHGLMNMVERLGGRFLEENGRDRDQSLYEAESAPPMGGLMPMPTREAYRFYDDHLQYTKKGGDEHDYRDLIEFIEQQLWADFVDSPSQEETVITRTSQVVAMEQQVEYLALNALVQNRDHVQSNFHLSPQLMADGVRRWEFYPWDLDTTFGCHRPDGWDQTLCEVMDHEVWAYGGVAPRDELVGGEVENWMNLLIHLTLNEPVCRRRFHVELCDMIRDPWWTEDLEPLMLAFERHLVERVVMDPNVRNPGRAAYSEAIDKLLAYPQLRAQHFRDRLGCGEPTTTTDP